MAFWCRIQLTDFFSKDSSLTTINAALLMILVPILVFLFSTFWKRKWIGINLFGYYIRICEVYFDYIASNWKGGVLISVFKKGDFIF
ncbi:MAG: hypothetical protein IPP53_17070 [Bacteroidetes bacterium]|nr:hypothetical protein [Bacteroidota bacterium]